MHKVDGNGAFAHRGSDTLDIAGANVTHGKDPRQIGFEHLHFSNVPALRARAISY